MRTAKWLAPFVLLALTGVGCGGSGGGGGGVEAPAGPSAFESMRKFKAVRIATDAVNLPFEYGEGTGVQGFDVDLGNEIAKDLGYEPKWIKMNFEKLFDLLKNSEVELVISAISITEERKEDFSFSDPYFESGNTIARRKDKTGIKDLASLAGKKVGVQSSTTGHKFMETQKTAAGVQIVKFPTLDDALGALNRTEIDAVVGDEPILTYSIYKSFDNLMTTGVRLTEEQYGVVLRKNETELLAKVNATIARLKNEKKLEELRTKWFQKVMEEAELIRKKLQQAEELKEAPKAVAFGIRKTGGTFRMDRLDGFQITLVGPKGTYTSSPISTSGNSGSCRFNPVPPGDYRMNISILRISNQAISIPKLPTRSLTFSMSIGNTVDISAPR